MGLLVLISRSSWPIHGCDTPSVVLAVDRLHHPSSSLSNSGKRSTSTPLSSSNPSPLEPIANEARRLTSPHRYLPCVTPLSTALFRRSLVKPWVLQAPHGSAIRRRLNLHHRHPPVCATTIINSTAVYLTISCLPRWAICHLLPQISFTIVWACSSASLSPTAHH
jgi:hypothetical protein